MEDLLNIAKETWEKAGQGQTPLVVAGTSFRIPDCPFRTMFLAASYILRVFEHMLLEKHVLQLNAYPRE